MADAKQEDLSAEVSSMFRHLSEQRRSSGNIVRHRAHTAERKQSMSASTTEHLARDMLAKLRAVPMFADCPEEFLGELVQELQPEAFIAGDNMITEGEEGKEMFFLIKGSVSVVKDEKELAVLKEGAFFGEVALTFQETKRTATIRAKEDCFVVILLKATLDKAFEKFPEQKMAILSLAQTRLTQDALRKVLGGHNVNAETFTERLESVLKTAIHEKNKEIFLLNDEVRKLRRALDKRDKQVQMLNEIKGSSASLINVHQAAAESAVAPSTAAVKKKKKIGPKSHWRLFNEKNVRAALDPAGQKAVQEVEDDMPSLNARPRRFIRMLQKYPCVRSFVFLREQFRVCDEDWFVAFIHGDGLKAMLRASAALGQRPQPSVADVGAQLELILCWRTLMNREFVLECYLGPLASTLPGTLETAMDTENLMARTRLFELTAALCMVNEDGLNIVYDALREVAKRRHYPNPFSLLVQSLSLVKEAWFMTSVMMVVNGLLHMPPSVEERVRLRKELFTLGFKNIVTMMHADTEWLRNGQMLKTQLEFFEEQERKDEEELDSLHQSLPVDINDPHALMKRLLESSSAEEEQSIVGLLQQLSLLAEDKASKSMRLQFLESVAAEAVSRSTKGIASTDAKITASKYLTALEAQKSGPTAVLVTPAAAAASGVAATPKVQRESVDARVKAAAVAAEGEPDASAKEGASGGDVAARADSGGGGAAPPPAPAAGGPPPPPPPMMGGGGPPPPPPPMMGGGGPPPPPMMGGGPPPPPMMGGGGPGLGLPPKPKPNPSVKMLPFYWGKIPPLKVAKTGWVKPEIEDVEERIDGKELEELFAAKAAKKKDADEAEKAKKKSKPTVVTLFDMRRGNNIAIMLSQFKKKFPDFRSICAAIDAGDDDALTVTDLETLIKYAPEPEEIEAVNAYEGDVALLGTAEQFFMELKNVANVEGKLRALLFKKEFDTKIAECNHHLDVLIDAAKMLKDNKKFKQLLEIILGIGNYMNAQNNRGGAYGYTLESLKKLSDTKSTANKRMTLLHYVASFVERKFPDVLAVVDELQGLEDATKMPLDMVKADVAGLVKSLKQLDSLATEGGSEPIFEALRRFSDRAHTELRLAEKDIPVLETKVTDLATHFGEDPKKIDLQSVCQVVHGFLQKFSAFHAENLARRAAEEKRKAREAKKAAEAGKPRKKGSVKNAPAEECTVDSLLAQVRKGNFKLRTVDP